MDWRKTGARLRSDTNNEREGRVVRGPWEADWWTITSSRLVNKGCMQPEPEPAKGHGQQSVIVSHEGEGSGGNL